MASDLAIFYWLRRPVRFRDSGTGCKDGRSTCNLTGLFLAPPSHAWKKFSPPWNCAAASRGLRRRFAIISRIRVSLHPRKTVWSSPKLFLHRENFRQSRRHVRRASTPVAGRRETTARRTQAIFLPLSVPPPLGGGWLTPAMDLSSCILISRVPSPALTSASATNNPACLAPMLSAASRATPPPMVRVSVFLRRNAPRPWHPRRRFTYAISVDASPPRFKISSTNPRWKPGPAKTAALCLAAKNTPWPKCAFPGFVKASSSLPRKGSRGRSRGRRFELETLLELLGI